MTFPAVLNKKMLGLILKQKTVRVTILLIFILVISCIALFTTSYSFENKIAENNKQIQEIQTQLKALQMAASEPEAEVGNEIIMDQALAPYDQIVPFISFLESLFAVIDKESKITIKNDENQIMINRYADYEVKLSPGDKMDLFLKALDGLYKSKYLTKITNFEINYSPTEDEKSSKIEDINLVVRLYFE